MSAADRHPEPPAALDTWDLPLVEVEPPWYRCHRIIRDPIFSNMGRLGRFNAPNAEYEVLSLGTDPYCAFIEPFGQALRRNARGFNVISDADLADRCLCRIEATPSRGLFRLVDLTGAGLSRVGADSRPNTMTDDRGLPQRWTAALWRHPQSPDGLLYRVRHEPARFGIALRRDSANRNVVTQVTTIARHPPPRRATQPRLDLLG